MTEQEIVKAANAYADELGLDEMDYDIAVTDFIAGAEWMKDKLTQSKQYNYNPNRISLRPHWKPSEEQMQILEMVLTDEAMDDNVHSVLESLLKQLKAL